MFWGELRENILLFILGGLPFLSSFRSATVFLLGGTKFSVDGSSISVIFTISFSLSAGGTTPSWDCIAPRGGPHTHTYMYYLANWLNCLYFGHLWRLLRPWPPLHQVQLGPPRVSLQCLCLGHLWRFLAISAAAVPNHVLLDHCFWPPVEMPPPLVTGVLPV